jgi:hypothetical protein
MKKKYVCVNFENSKYKYLYELPEFKVLKGNIVKVETISGESLAIVVRFAKYNKKNIPYKLGLKNIIEIVDGNTSKNIKIHKRNLSGKVLKNYKFIKGFKKTRVSKFVTEYTYKNIVTASVCFFKDDRHWIIDFYANNSLNFIADGFGRTNMKNLLYQIKLLLKDYANNIIDKQVFEDKCKKLSTDQYDRSALQI